jgi:hypothetical protein
MQGNLEKFSVSNSTAYSERTQRGGKQIGSKLKVLQVIEKIKKRLPWRCVLSGVI